MGFSAKQVQALKRDLDRRHIRTREVHGPELCYIEGWHAIAQANRIFGFDGWSRETLDAKCVLARENRGSFIAVYTAKVRISVATNSGVVIRDGHGTGEGRAASPGEVHDTALKAAETDATKRALVTFGKPFGLALYDASRRHAAAKPSAELSAAEPSAINLTAVDPSPKDRRTTDPGAPLKYARDDTTPIPRPSRYYGRRQDAVSKEISLQKRSPDQQPSLATSIVPPAPEQHPQQIDKSVLAIAEPKRLRDKAHLRFVASQPCLICAYPHSDPHHLRFAQPRALGLKVSDEFTVPLCRDHHQQLHQAGNEVAWWHQVQIKPLEIARQLWEKSHASQKLENTPTK
jgi:DNA recombination protein Rad52